MPDTETLAQLAEIQSRLAALEQASTDTGGSISPNYLTVDAQGHVSASFTGLINALGLVIPESQSASLALPNAIEWQDTRASSAGAVREIIEGQSPTLGVHRLAMLAQDPLAGSLAQFTAQVGGDSALRADTEAGGVQIIDTAGTSSFLQLETAGKWVAEFGFNSFVWPGGTQTVLAATPTFGPAGSQVFPVLGFANLSLGDSGYAYSQNIGLGSVEIGATVTNRVPPAGTTDGVYWLVLHD
jgi:hypothetical protein